jgi:hypothetical protein
MRKLHIFLAAPFVEDQLFDQFVAAIADVDSNIWQQRRVSFDESLADRTKHELYLRDMSIILTSDPDRIGRDPPEEIRRVRTIQVFNATRLLVPVLLVPPESHGPWQHLFRESRDSVTHPQYTMERLHHLLHSPRQLSAEAGDISAHDLLQLARVLNLYGDHENALEYLQRVVNLESGLSGLWTNLGYTYMLLERWGEGLDACEHAFMRARERTTSKYCAGVCLNALDRFDEAIAAFDRSLATHPEHSAAWVGKGIAFLALKQRDQAVKAFARSLQVKPDNPWASEDARSQEIALRYMSEV